MKGWYGDKHRHSMASKGIRSAELPAWIVNSGVTFDISTLEGMEKAERFKEKAENRFDEVDVKLVGVDKIQISARGKRRSRRLNEKEWEALDEMYGYDIPEYFTDIRKAEITVKVDDGWQGVNEHVITPYDVVEYYHKDARNLLSGARSLGTIVGDWRNVDAIANEVLQIYKAINRNAIVKEADKYGMKLR